MKSLFSRFIAGMKVFRCTACHHRMLEKRLLCAACEEELAQAKRWECGICNRPLPSCTCASEYLQRHGVKRSIKLCRYRPDIAGAVQNRLLYFMKRKSIRSLQRFMARELAQSVKQNILLDQNYFVSYIPRTTKRRRLMGFDQSRLLGEALAEELSLPFHPLLSRCGKSRMQKSMENAEQRRQNVKGCFRLSSSSSFKGSRILLLDDMVTTGSTMAEAASLLKRAGAKEVIAVSIAIMASNPNMVYAQRENSHLPRFTGNGSW